MLIHHITDLHVPEDGSAPEFDHVKVNIRSQLDFVSSQSPDLLVITGDLGMTDASRYACDWIKDQLPDIPTVVIPGNHDDPEMIQEVFGDWRGSRDFETCSLLFLDSSSFYVSEDQLNTLSTFDPNKLGILFLHHPPCSVGDGFMNRNQSLKNIDETSAAIGNSKVQHVFCGHFHNEAHIQADGFELYLTPSPAFQVSLTNPEFESEDFVPGVRVIDIGEAGVSEMVYLAH